MDIEKAIEIVEQYNSWRSDHNVPSKIEMPNPKQLGIAITVLVKNAKIFQSCKMPVIHEIDINGICKDCGKDIKN